MFMKSFNLGNIGQGLLNTASQEQRKNVNKTHIIQLQDIIPNDMNNYKIEDEDVESLVESIRLVGLQQNLVVIPQDDGKYRLTTGHKRYAALKRLYEENPEKWEYVNVYYSDIENVNLPISNELKELYLITTTNSESRNKAADIYTSYLNLKKIYQAAQEAGYKIPGGMRKYLSERLNRSAAQIGKLDYIESHGTDELKKEILSETFDTIAVANSVAHMPEEEQREVIDEIKKREKSGEKQPVTAKDVENIRKDKKKEEIIEQESIDQYTQNVNKKMNQLCDMIPSMKEKNVRSVMKSLKKIENEIEKIEGMLSVKNVFYRYVVVKEDWDTGKQSKKEIIERSERLNVGELYAGIVSGKKGPYRVLQEEIVEEDI